MSFTILHKREDGTVKPIKMSIFDAFRGVPDPKPRKPQPCPCCGKTHAPKLNAAATAAETKAEDTDKDAKAKDGEAEKKDDKNAKAADDQIMLRMKAENASAQWKDILEATSYTSMDELKARWREIKNQLVDFKKELEGEKESEEKAKAPDKEAKAARNHEKGLKKQAAAAAADKDKPSGKAGEMKTWAESYDKKKWRFLASKHYDKTGQRISPEQARKMAEGN